MLLKHDLLYQRRIVDRSDFSSKVPYKFYELMLYFLVKILPTIALLRVQIGSTISDMCLCSTVYISFICIFEKYLYIFVK